MAPEQATVLFPAVDQVSESAKEESAELVAGASAMKALHSKDARDHV